MLSVSVPSDLLPLLGGDSGPLPAPTMASSNSASVSSRPESFSPPLPPSRDVDDVRRPSPSSSSSSAYTCTLVVRTAEIKGKTPVDGGAFVGLFAGDEYFTYAGIPCSFHERDHRRGLEQIRYDVFHLRQSTRPTKQ